MNSVIDHQQQFRRLGELQRQLDAERYKNANQARTIAILRKRINELETAGVGIPHGWERSKRGPYIERVGNGAWIQEQGMEVYLGLRGWKPVREEVCGTGSTPWMIYRQPWPLPAPAEPQKPSALARLVGLHKALLEAQGCDFELNWTRILGWRALIRLYRGDGVFHILAEGRGESAEAACEAALEYHKRQLRGETERARQEAETRDGEGEA